LESRSEIMSCSYCDVIMLPLSLHNSYHGAVSPEDQCPDLFFHGRIRGSFSIF
jgi:hypothetical protein